MINKVMALCGEVRRKITCSQLLSLPVQLSQHLFTTITPEMLCSNPRTRHQGGTSRANSTVAVSHSLPSTGRQEKGDGTVGSKTDFMACKVGAGSRVMIMKSSADNTMEL